MFSNRFRYINKHEYETGNTIREVVSEEKDLPEDALILFR
jgi:hypothetical protein